MTDDTPEPGHETRDFTVAQDVALPPGASAPPAAPPGYRLREELARGGMGVVYRADDLRFGREVAVKVVRDEFRGDPRTIRRFTHESEITGRLQHPGVPPAHDLGTLPGGGPYLAMKLIRGKTLAALLADRPTPAADLPRFVQVFEQICQTVGFAHTEGYIHRDLKPANVMVGAFGEVQVMDWGLAKSLRADRPAPPPDDEPAAGLADWYLGSSAGPTGTFGATRDGAVLGTPWYMPPEQARGQVAEVDTRSDVFSLGGVLCAILTGHPPVNGSDGGDTLRRAAACDMTDTLARLDGCGADADLIALAKCCLAPRKADRPADAAAVAGSVAAYRAGVEVRLRVAEADRAAAAVRAVELRKRRRVQLALAAAVVAIAGLIAAAAWWDDRQAGRRAAADLHRQLDDQTRERAEAERAARNGQDIAVALGRCEDALKAEDADRAADALDRAEKRRPDPGGEPFADRLARCRADLAMLRDLDRVYGLMVTASIDPRQQSAGRLTEAAAEAFRRFGIEPGRTPPAEAAERIRASAIRERLLTALDKWHSIDSYAGRGTEKDAVLTILAAVDQDPFRDAVRAAIGRRDTTRVCELVAGAEALAQPTGFAVVLGTFTRALPLGRRNEILRAAVTRHPDNLMLLLGLAGGELLYDRDEHDPRVALPWGQAAVAARPRSGVAWMSLGAILSDMRVPGEAEVAFRKAILLDPELALPRYGLGLLLDLQGDTPGAVAAFEEAVRLNPTYVDALNELAWIHATHPDARWRGGRAVELATKACELMRWQEPQFIDTLAAAHADAGNFAKAIEFQKKALAFPAFAQAQRDQTRAQLACYERNAPYRKRPVVVAPAPRPKPPMRPG